MFKTTQVAKGLISFAQNEILPVLNGWQLWAASAALKLAEPKAEELLAVLAENKAVSALGVIKKDGTVDVEAVISASKETVRSAGKLILDLPYIGEIKFGEDDFDKLREYIVKLSA